MGKEAKFLSDFYQRGRSQKTLSAIPNWNGSSMDHEVGILLGKANLSALASLRPLLQNGIACEEEERREAIRGKRENGASEATTNGQRNGLRQR